MGASGCGIWSGLVPPKVVIHAWVGRSLESLGKRLTSEMRDHFSATSTGDQEAAQAQRQLHWDPAEKTAAQRGSEDAGGFPSPSDAAAPGINLGRGWSAGIRCARWRSPEICTRAKQRGGCREEPRVFPQAAPPFPAVQEEEPSIATPMIGERMRQGSSSIKQ
ncbi:hypothetical protein Droror1_Dr00017452 [Drosera rotundifolia]